MMFDKQIEAFTAMMNQDERAARVALDSLDYRQKLELMKVARDVKELCFFALATTPRVVQEQV